MKKIVLGLAFTVLPLAAVAQNESFTVDPIHSFAHFGIDHLGLSQIWGRFNKMSGKFSLDRAAKKAAIEVSIDTASVDTGDHERGSRPRTRDEHLRTTDFFNSAEYPRMNFKSTNVKFTGDNPSEIEGQLTMLGVTKPVTLRVDRFTCKDHPLAKRPACGGNVSGSLKRSEFGMKYGLQGMSDEVRLMINFEALKDQ
jgi:polyisoprenoid-binding protein YceI